MILALAQDSVQRTFDEIGRHNLSKDDMDLLIWSKRDSLYNRGISEGTLSVKGPRSQAIL